MSRTRRKRFGASEASAVAIVAAFGALVLIALPSLRASEQDGWPGEIERALKANNYKWLSLDVQDGVAFVRGVAPDVDSRAIGVETVREQLRLAAQPEARAAVVVDATTLDGVDQPALGATVAALPVDPSGDACAAAFASAMQGRSVEFVEREPALALSEPALLDVIAATAIRCRAHPVEIAVRTDALAGGAARRLSQGRANALKAYLVERGAPADRLTPVGYGRAQAGEAPVAFTVSHGG